MPGIDPTASAAHQPPHLSNGPASPSGPNATGNTGGSAAAGSAASTSLLAHSSTTVTFVTQQVDTMLANIGNGVDQQQTLRMLIALMILQELLGNGNGNGNGEAADLLGLLNGNGDGNGNAGANGASAGVAAMSSQTTMMQVHHEQTLAFSHQASQAAAASSYADGPNGTAPPNGQPQTDLFV